VFAHIDYHCQTNVRDDPEAGFTRLGTTGGSIMTIVDTHLHIIDLAKLDYPWLGEAPRLHKDHLYETYAAEAQRLGITDVLHMEVDVAEAEIEAETAMVKAVAAQPGCLIRGAISACRPEDPAFPAFVERFAGNGFVKGFRRILHTQPDALSEAALFRTNLRRLSGTGLSFDICALPHQIDRAIALVDLAPDVFFILDHCGVPAVKDRAVHPWAEGITEIARRPNVAVKISGVVAYGADEWTVEDLRPFVTHAIESFGWDRVVWGSDWPVCTLTANLTRWVEATHQLIAGASEGEKTRLLQGNARRIYRI
jgi:predicted TIM-barrel fold metal-dependent hydrolase